MPINFNAEPYYDDYDENKKFYKILFRPGYSVQARELTQLQTVLQKQIARFGNHMFKDGAMVIPGQITLDTKLAHVKLTTEFGTVNTSTFVRKLIGTIVEGQTSGVRAQVVQATAATSTDPAMLFIRYTSNGVLDELGLDTSAQKEFSPDEILTTIITEGEAGYSVQIQSTNTIANPATGESSAASIGKGVYFIKGHFVLVDEQTIILEKFSKKPTGKVGLRIVETSVEPEDDETLLDNAQSSYNYAAPGAHRYSIDAILEKRALSYTGSDDFIELLRIDRGVIQQLVNKTEYSYLTDTLARRTYDESGDYAVRPFGIDVREWRNNDRGAWKHQTVYLAGDIVTFNGKKYVAQKSGVSLNVTSPIEDTTIGWEETANPTYNRGIYSPPETTSKAVLDSNGNPTFNYDTDGRIVSQIFSTQPATVADNEELNAKLAVGLESGKAYVRGYEIEKSGTTYVEVKKARETATESNVLLSLDYGNYVIVNNVNYAPDIGGLPVVDIYNAYTTTAGKIPAVSGVLKVGTARIRGMEWHAGNITGNDAYYKLFLFDIKMAVIPGDANNNTYSFNSTAKQFRIAGTSDASSFTADVVPVPEILPGSITFNTANTTTTIAGVNTKFKTNFVVGDYILLNGIPRLITGIANDLSMTISTAVPSQNGTAVIKCTTLLNETSKTSLIFNLPRVAIKSISSISYYLNEVFKTQSTSAVGGTCQLIITTSGGTEFSNPNDSNNYAIFSSSTGGRVTPVSTARSSDNLSVIFTLSSSFANTQFIVYATVQKDRTVGLKSKAQTRVTIQKTTGVDAQTRTIWLGKPDGIRLLSVKMRSGTFAAPTGTFSIDITTRYTFDGGQTESYYGNSSIRLKDGQAMPIAPIEITFDYFNHGAGDFFTVDSYTNYADIPKFNGISLRDVIDFRPRADDSLTGNIIFTGGNDLLPKYGADVLLSYEHYLGRKSKIAISKSGDFKVVDGGSSLFAVEPNDPLDSMLIYKLDLSPYTFDTTTASVKVTPVENKRYTMRDIGKIEKRVNQLEYYTALTMLEQETANTQIKDDDGLDRLKNGFIVDSFKNQSIGDTLSPDYVCAIDTQNGVLRPFYSMDNIEFVDMYSNNTDRAARNYRLTGDLITLPYTDIPIISQQQASEKTNINPFAVFTFIGRADITPPFDRWFEVNRRPDIVVNVDGNYAALMSMAEPNGVLGTLWNAWQTQWTGCSASANTTQQTIARNTATLSAGQETRTGIQTSVQESIERTVTADRTLSIVTIPYIRSRNILVQAKGLKQNTIFYPYFDKTAVKRHCTPADKLIIDRTGFNSRAFNTDDNNDAILNVGGDYSNPARMMGPNPDFALNVGDILYVSKRAGVSYNSPDNSPTTAIVVGESNKKTSGIITERSLSIVNVKDSSTADGNGFLPGDEIRGSISGAAAKVVAHTVNALGGNIVTNDDGEVNFIFNIPNTTAERFRTGKKEFALLTTETFSIETSASSLIAEYDAQGFVETKQATIESVRNAVLVQEAISQNRSIESNSTGGGVQYVDPLAQTFLIEGMPDGAPIGAAPGSVSGGCFLTSVDVYFATKDTAIPVTLQLREVVNGYPGQRILPFGEVVMSADSINISNNSSLATRFKFRSPVFVANKTEYAIVLMADSINYTVWTATLGSKDVLTNIQIDKQPYAGVLFKSQNASTWTAEQNMDLKFKINRAKFVTGKIGKIEFENTILPDVELGTDPLQFVAGSQKIRVSMRDHGMTAGAYPSKVTLRPVKELTSGTITVSTVNGITTVTGIGTTFMSDLEAGAALYKPDGTLIGNVATTPVSQSRLTLNNVQIRTYSGRWQFINPVYGINPQHIFKQHIVSAVEEFDSFILTLSQSATQTGYGGGSGIRSTRQIQYDAVQPMLTYQTFVNTNMTTYFKGVSGKSIDGTQVPYLKPSETGLKFIQVVPNEVYNMPIPHMIVSDENARARPGDGTVIDIGHKTGGNRNSALIALDISSDIDTLSPVIDARSMSAILISNKINRPSVAMNIQPLDARDIIINSADITVRTAVVSCYRLDSIVTINTLEPHGFQSGQLIRVALTDNTDFNGTFKIDSASETSFSYYLIGSNFASQANPDGDAGWVYGNVIKIGDIGDNRAAIRTIVSGQVVRISGVKTGGTSNTIDIQVMDVAPDGSYIRVTTDAGIVVPGTGNISIVAHDRFKTDFTPVGSSTYSKYVTKKIQLANPSTFLKIRFAATIPTEAEIRVFYKLGLVGSDEDFSTVEYRRADFTPQRANDGIFKNVDIDLPNLPEFNSLVVKVAFKSDNSTRVPQMRELRIIACA